MNTETETAVVHGPSAVRRCRRRRVLRIKNRKARDNWRSGSSILWMATEYKRLWVTNELATRSFRACLQKQWLGFEASSSLGISKVIESVIIIQIQCVTLSKIYPSHTNLIPQNKSHLPIRKPNKKKLMWGWHNSLTSHSVLVKLWEIITPRLGGEPF